MKASVASARSKTIDAKIRSGQLDAVFPAQFPTLPGWDVAGVFDTSGAGLLPDAIALAGDAARVITIADPDAAEHGVRFSGQDPADRAPESLPELAALLATGRLTLPVWRAYPLAEAASAHADLEAGRNHGKIVLVP